MADRVNEAVRASVSRFDMDSIPPDAPQNYIGMRVVADLPVPLSSELETHVLAPRLTVVRPDTLRDTRPRNYTTEFERTTFRSTKPSSTPVRKPEVVLTIAMLHPKRAMKDRVFHVLASSTIESTLDRFRCVTDDMPDLAGNQSGYICIESVLYTRTGANTVDYTEPIMQFLEENERYTHEGLAGLRRASAAETRWEDVSLRLGKAYVFMHQGDCGHLVVVLDMHLHTHRDRDECEWYPMLVFEAKVRARRCSICDVRPGNYATYGDRLAPTEPCVFCHECYDQLHKLPDGSPAYENFRVFSYLRDP